MKNVIENKNSFTKKLNQNCKKFRNTIVLLKKIYRFTFYHFLIEHVVFTLIVKNFIKYEKFHFVTNLSWIRKKCKKKIAFQKAMAVMDII